MKMDPKVQQRFQAVLDRLCTRLEEDYYVLAAVLYGSLARGQAWERSDIDIVIVIRDGYDRDNRYLSLVDEEINISAEVVSRNNFKRGLEGALQGSWTHSVRADYKLLFSKDETIERWLSEPAQVNTHDRSYQLLKEVSAVPYFIDKSTKWLTVKEDVNYCFLWLLFAVNTLAKVEVILNGMVPGREALDQAIKLNPNFFGTHYSGLVNGPKTPTTVGATLAAIEGYLNKHQNELFSSVLLYLDQAGGPVPLSEMEQHFKKKIPDTMLLGVFDWLARQGIIHKLSAPVRLTRKSTIELEEPAFYYDTGDISDWEG